MKSIYYPLTALLLLSAFGFSGCSDEKETPGTSYGDELITIVPSVEGMEQTLSARSGVSSLTHLSSKSLMLDITQGADPYNYSGLEYKIQNGTVTLKSGVTPPRWKAYIGSDDRNNVTITARWPLATEVLTDQSGSMHTEADFLYYGGKPEITDNQMKFTLKHVNTKIRINLKHGTDFEWGTTDENLKTVKLTTKELVYTTEDENGLWKVDSNGVPVPVNSVSSSSYTAHQETPATSGQDETFEVIILPQEVTDMSNFFKIKAGTKIYSFSMTGGYTFNSGETYTFNLRLGKDKVTLDGGIGVTGWTEITLPPNDSEDESRVKTAADLTARINGNDSKYHASDKFRDEIIYSGSEEIAAETFKDKQWLKRFVVTKNITIGSEAFSGCTNLTELVFAASDAEMNGITNDTFTGLADTEKINLIIGAAEYQTITDLSTKTWRGKTWQSITQY